MRVRPRNELMEAIQFTWDNAEEVQKKLGGKLLWGPRTEDGAPQPVIEFPREVGYIKGPHISARAYVSDWILVDFGGSIAGIVSDQHFHMEYDADECQGDEVTIAFWNRRQDYVNEHFKQAQAKAGE